MAVVVRFDWEDVTPEEYDRVIAELDLEREPAAGGIFHVAGFDGGALRITDVWESEEAQGRFQQERLIGALRRAGVTTQPRVSVFPAHNFFANADAQIPALG
jgi:hypothetical protein